MSDLKIIAVGKGKGRIQETISRAYEEGLAEGIMQGRAEAQEGLDKASYNIGREDERQEWTYKCADKLYEHGEDISEAFPEFAKKIRERTIDECIAKINREHSHSAYYDDVYEAIMLLEQLKEQKNV